MEGEASQMMQQLGYIDCNKHPEKHLRINRKIKIDQAKSPSDILWSNIGVGRETLLMETIRAILIVFVVAFCAQSLFATEITA